MPENNFMQVKTWVRDEASHHGIRLSSREAHRATNAYLLEAQAREDGPTRTTYHDPTAEEAVRNVVREWLKQKRPTPGHSRQSAAPKPHNRP